MRMLERHFRVSTRYGGGFVESIDGHSGNGSQRDWFYYVNGVQASQGAARRPFTAATGSGLTCTTGGPTDSIPAVVGSFPEPFRNGVGGKRFPTTIECATDVTAACKQVTSALGRATSRPPTSCWDRARAPTRWAWSSAPGASSRPRWRRA